MAKSAESAIPSAGVPASLVDQLREIGRRFGENLTIVDVGRLLGKEFEVAADGVWTVELKDGSTLLAKAKAKDAAVTWLKFRPSTASGLTFADAERIYGRNHTIREGQKDGTDIHYSPGAASSVPAGTYVGLRLWARSVAPSAPVTQVTLSASGPSSTVQ